MIELNIRRGRSADQSDVIRGREIKGRRRRFAATAPGDFRRGVFPAESTRLSLRERGSCMEMGAAECGDLPPRAARNCAINFHQCLHDLNALRPRPPTYA